MIAVDSSAVIAMLAGEADAPRIRAALQTCEGAIISTANLLEVQLVLGGKRVTAGWTEVEELLAAYAIAPRPFDDRQLHIARDAATRYGKGRHPAALNYGDCFAYALAKSENVPLLCTGRDFEKTDAEVELG
ncbi:MAG TPA: type II toxin-antitoxin system VapC family toxin [Rhizomicrobium sp.]|nr:type II toxin-antitoxin system VapC family toxin [Rhizomicrobium sp.]